MRIGVFGLGYVGCASGACLAHMGHEVLGIDVNQTKIDMIRDGRAPVIEGGLQELLAKVTGAGNFAATSESRHVVSMSDLIFICVGTPSSPNGSLSLEALRRVATEIGVALATRDRYLTIAVRSTVLPGTVEGEVIPLIERHSGKAAGSDFGICMVPEFLREGTSVDDFFHPPKTVIGELDTRSGEMVFEALKSLAGPFIRTTIRVAELVKYADNAFHALKVTFANEVGNICQEAGCDSHEVMNIFCMDTKLNLSPYYLKPGFAFGGSCLPKDLRALTYQAKIRDIPTPVLDAVLVSNREQIAKVVRMLLPFKGKPLGFMGLSFKHGTDDLRESPILEVIETMIGKGFDVSIYDEYVSIAQLVGSNKEYIDKEIPHVSSLMCASAHDLINRSSVIIVSNSSTQFGQALIDHLTPEHVVIDLVRIVNSASLLMGQYHGICW